MHKNLRLLKDLLKRVTLLLVAFFSLNINVDAANFAYNAFDWDKFYEENVGYWTDVCKEQSGDISLDDCLEITLSGKKDYYVNLYKLLAKYEAKGYKLDDNILLVTTFFALTPDSFSDIPEEYLRDYIDGSAYNVGVDDIDSYDPDVDEEIYNQETYFQEEKDSLKTLMKHMFAYPASCNGTIGTPEVDANGNTFCAQGTLSGSSCVGNIKTFNLNYTEYLISKWNWVGRLFGVKDKSREACTELGGSLSLTHKKEINYEVYWDYLINSSYFDNKVHLTSYYSAILEETNHTLMRELSDDEREQYAEELIKIREGIVLEIQSIYNTYGTFAETPDSFITAGSLSASAWWPIGSDEVTLENGLTFAIGNPVSVSVSSYFGPRDNPFGEGGTQQHTGIDISNVSEGVTNVVAVKDGVVVYPTAGSETNCPSSRGSSDKCGGGYGNYVIIQHNDGTFSLYAHLYAGSITVSANDSVKQGQVIGKVGNSGYSTGPHLHFEIRQGTNSSSAAVDPLNYISAENPRSSGGSSSEFLKMLHYFEGGCNSPFNGNNYVVHNDGYNIPTVGYGIALEYNVERFQKYGINVSSMGMGAEISKDIVHQVEMDALSSFRSYVQNYLAKYAISLSEYQVDCLTMVAYQFGNLGNLGTTYPQYGNTESLRQSTHSESKNNWYYFKENPSTGNGRAEATWKLFHEGIYTYDQNKC